MDEISRYQAIQGCTNDQAWEFHEIIHDARCSGEIENVLEIGSFRGDSLRVWLDAFAPSLLISIEVEDSERTREGLDPLAALGVKVIYGESQDGESWRQVKNLLSQVKADDPHRPLDFVYIDGDHRYAAARRDFFLYSPLVRPGGLIVMDDAVCPGNADIQVNALIPELSSLYRTKLISGRTEIVNGQAVTGGRLVIYSTE